ncbi:hypothetical protein GGQ19_002989 [Salinibacter ruber]|nr:hypothetical protein [Salinibacter ruber]
MPNGRPQHETHPFPAPAWRTVRRGTAHVHRHSVQPAPTNRHEWAPGALQMGFR